MQCEVQQIKKADAGFTLVELAIVMIIIGLLIGGVLKGQELIANAQVTAQVAQLKSIDAAVSTFRDTYKAFPGDMSNAEQRLPGCAGGTTGCRNNTGDINGRLGVFATPAADENMFFWGHLAAADLFSGVDGSAVPDEWGQAFPAASSGGGYHAGQYNGAGVDLPGGVAARAGTYLAWHATADVIPSAGDALLSTASAAKIDLKMDDGAPNTGSVIAMGGRAAGGCALGDGPTDVYDEAAGDQTCGLFIRIQQ